MKTGRPKGPAKVMFRKRLTQAQVESVESFLADAPPLAVVPVSQPAVVIHGEDEIKALKDQLQALLEGAERDAKTIAALNDKITKVARMSNEERFNNLLFQYDKIKAHIKKLEESQ